jgi:uncharacterized membrane protein YccC
VTLRFAESSCYYCRRLGESSVMHPSSVFDRLAQYRTEAGLTVRMSAAGLITFAVAHLLGLTQIYWAVLTAVIVMQASVGGSLKAMIDRFIGTIGGAGWGVAVTLAIPHPGMLSTGLALAVALVPLAAVVAFQPHYRIAPVTAAIVLLANSSPAGVVAAAFERVLEIGLGSVIALGVALLVSSTRAQKLLCAAGRDALALMADQARLLLGGGAEPPDPTAVQALHDRIRMTIEHAVTIADEAARERRSYITDAPDPEPLVRTLRRLSHDLVIIARALTAPLPETAAARLAQPVAAVADALPAALNDIGRALASRSAPPDLTAVADALASFEAVLAALRREGVTRELPEEAVERIFGLAFGFEQIYRNLGELAGRVGELADRR